MTKRLFVHAFRLIKLGVKLLFQFMEGPSEILKERRREIIVKSTYFTYTDNSRNDYYQDIDFLTDMYKRPLFNYINFCDI